MNVRRMVTFREEDRVVTREGHTWSLWKSPGQTTGVGSHSLLQGIFPTQGSNPGLPHCRPILYHLSRQGSPRPTQEKQIHLELYPNQMHTNVIPRALTLDSSQKLL